MQFTDRLHLRKPDQDDAYQVDDFNANFQHISEAFASVPRLTDYLTLEEFIASGTATDLKKGDTVAINDIIYILVGDNPLDESQYMPYGAEAVVIMREYIPVSERIRGCLYLQLGKTRLLIVKVFKKFYNREYTETDTSDTLTFKQTTEKTTNVSDGNKYRFTCKNVVIIQPGEVVERVEGQLYLVVK